MTPAERLVVEMATRHLAGEAAAYNIPGGAELLQAVEALEQERAGAPLEARVERELTWGQVVEGDEIYSAKVDKWYAVTGAVRHIGAPTVTVSLQGLSKPLKPKPLSEPVRVRRGETGAAVDVIASVLWSR